MAGLKDGIWIMFEISADKRRPNFLVLGGQRCGTTWLFRCMEEHPEILLPKQKDLAFFDKNPDKGIQWYLDQFSSVQNEKAIGEISPEYISSDDCPKLIKEYFPDIRLVLSMRNPVERMFSEYSMRKRCGREYKEFAQAVSEDYSYVTKGLYFRHISRYLEFFPREAMCLVKYDDICSSPLEQLKKIFSFLDVDTGFVPGYLNRRCNMNYGQPGMKRFNRAIVHVKSMVESSAFGNKLIWLARDMGIVDMYHNIITNSADSTPEAYNYQEIRRYFESDIKDLEGLLGESLPW